ncbi:metal ABC transporter solute-binding protein, Zn/Mn family [Schumannella sp. 10F1B-5-1]|uniref:metal ABC transporter solute-binding protein, Zn/Mn family n=1 Tax=Schumannella sp. 10F1B-5-1 TaxID=2590780 RepID=UPI001130CFF4|nr:zinc ABC transporter substrate-binding protein [Schumannella sp. 10F1B-5-1]TPW76812.1 ABC transporter substrate-binding protein [Schumannella sp. 10F1B-5-1]
MKTRALAAPALLAVAALGLAGCASTSSDSAAGADSGTVTVVASTDVYGSIAEAIGGDAVTVTSVIDDPDKDPHEYEADARTQLSLSKADIVIENGGGYDDFMDTMLKSADNSDAVVLNAADISGYDQEPAEGEFNEHMWYDYPTVGKVAEQFAAAVEKADPDAADTVKENLATFQKGLDELTADVDTLKGTAEGQSVAITEPVPLYLLDAAGFSNATPDEFSESIEEGTDAPVRVMQETLALFSEKKVALLVYNEQTDGPQTEQVLAAAKDAGIPAVGVTETLPKGEDYLSWQTSVIEQISSALGA